MRHQLTRYRKLDGFGTADMECRCGWRVYGVAQTDARKVFAAHQARAGAP